MRPVTIPIAALHHNVEAGFLDVVEQYLQRPETVSWSLLNNHEILQVVESIASKLPAPLASLTPVSAASSLLFCSKPDSDIRRIAVTLLSQGAAGGIPLLDITSAIWQAVPVLVGKENEQYCTVTVALALSTKTTDTIGPGFGHDTVSAVKTAFQCARRFSGRNGSFSCFPLIGVSQYTIHHDSLSLPFSLRAIALLDGQPLPSDCIATGGLGDASEPFRITAVGGVEDKAVCANREGFALLLYPHDNLPVGRMPKDIATIAVRTLDEAWLWGSLYAPGREDMLHRLSMALCTPHDFLVHCTTFPAFILRWLRTHKSFFSILEQILTTSELADELAEQLCVCVRDKNYSYERAEALGAMVTQEEGVDKMAGNSVLAALSWCAEQIGLANHRGDVENVNYWFERCEQYRERAMRRRPEGPQLYSRIINRFFGVSRRHSRYEFRPEMEPEFARELERQLHDYQSHCRDYGPCTDYGLGALLGTKAQNYGFCGSRWYEETRKTVFLAQQCFGDGQDKELFYHWQRQFAYLLFSMLDCLDGIAPEWILKTLEKYLQCSVEEASHELPEDRFHLFALVRTTADLPDHVPSSLCAALLDQLTTSWWKGFSSNLCQGDIHPWQLIWYNMGRLNLLFGRGREARLCWQRSVDLCLQGEVAVQFMAMLPMAAMRAAACLDKHIIHAGETILETAVSRLYSPHLSPLGKADDFLQALDFVTQESNRFFPFTYR